jgi:putative ABC transport system permease protein
VAERAAFHRRLLAALREEPGVVSAGSAARLPFAAQLDSTDAPGLVRFELAGRPLPPDARPYARVELVSAGYLETLGVPLIEGRRFDARDSLGGPPVALVSQELVRRYFLRETPIGQELTAGRRTIAVVGVVADVKSTALALRPEPTVYVPMEQSPLFRTRLAVRTQGDPRALMPALQRLVGTIDPELPVFDVKPLTQISADAVATQRFALWLFALFATLALLLSVLGVYGVVAYAVAHRLPEFGVRAALGANPGQLLALVLRQGVLLGTIGLAGGLGLSVVATGALKGLLFGVEPFDAPTLAGAATLFAAVVVGACLPPARRAGRVDPMTALRDG